MWSIRNPGLALGISLTMVSPWGIAQVKNDLVLEEVLVTAQKREQTLQDVPATVNALSEDQLKKTITTNFADIEAQSSGLQFGGSPRDGFQASIKVRGVGTSKNVPGIDPSVGVFVDEIPMGKLETAFANLSDVQQVEVLKGPQATLFGKSVSSGALTITTKKPQTETKELFLTANLSGKPDLQEFTVGGNLPITDRIAVRATGWYDRGDGFVTNVNPNINETTGTEFEEEGARIKVLFEPTDDLEIILSFEEQKAFSEGGTSYKHEAGDLIGALSAASGVNFPLFDKGDYKNSTTHNGRETRTEFYSMHVRWDYDENWSLHSISGYQNWDLDLDESDSTENPGSYGPARRLAALTVGNPNAAALLPGGFGDTSQQSELLGPFFTFQGSQSVTQEFRFNYESDEWTSVFGVFYSDTLQDNRTDLLQTVTIVPAAFVPFVLPAAQAPFFPNGFQVAQALVVDNMDEVVEMGIYSHNTIRLNEETDLIVGLRYSDVEKDSAKGIILGTGAFAPLSNTGQSATTTDIPEQSNSWDHVSGTLKINHHLNDDMSVYAGYSTAFKPGGVNSSTLANNGPGGAAPTTTGSNVDEETVQAFEVGFKGNFMGGAMRWNASAFYQVYEDFQVQSTTPGGLALLLLNAAEVQVDGFESNWEWQATRNLNVIGNMSYINARYDDFDNATCVRYQYGLANCDPVFNPNGNPNVPAQFTTDLSGQRLDGISPWSANVFLTWSDTLDNGWDYFVRGGYRFRSDIFYQADLDPDLHQSSYGVADASIGFTSPDDRYSVIFWVKNLTGKEYVVDATRSRDNTQPSAAQDPNAIREGFRETPGDGRAFGMSFNYTLPQE